MEDRIRWYVKAKFGLFIHWGAYSAGGVEASWPIMTPDLSEAMFRVPSNITGEEYFKLPERFNPIDFDPKAWVRLAAAAGMRYIVLTSKHHDGFCMFDAPGTDYKITNTPYGKDICLELAEACEDAGMPLGFYYSPPDMHHPGYRDTSKPLTKSWTGEPKRPEWNDYLDYMESHIRKLLTDYGKVRVLWFDGLANHGKYDPQRFHSLIKKLSPETLVNDRLGEGFDFITPEQFIPKNGVPVKTDRLPSGMDPGGDQFFRTVEFLYKIPLLKGFLRKQMKKYNDGELELSSIPQEAFPSPDRFQPWETCLTIGNTWAYNPEETAWKDPRNLVISLIEVASRGGNLLLNAGPDGRGNFPPQVLDRWEKIGRWTNKYGEALYGTTYAPIETQSWGRAVRSGDSLYLFVFDWPEERRLLIDPFPGEAKSVEIFDGEALEFSCGDNSLEIMLPEEKPDPDVPVLTVKISGDEPVWNRYSEPVETRPTHRQYLVKNAVAGGWINTLANGLIAFFSYRKVTAFTYSEAAVDAVIAVAIVSFLVSWILTDSTRKEIFKRNIIIPKKELKGSHLPKNTLLRAVIIMLVSSALVGAVAVDGLLFIFSPDGIGNWGYIILKAIYTGAAGAFSAILTVRSVFRDSFSHHR